MANASSFLHFLAPLKLFQRSFVKRSHRDPHYKSYQDFAGIILFRNLKKIIYAPILNIMFTQQFNTTSGKYTGVTSNFVKHFFMIFKSLYPDRDSDYVQQILNKACLQNNVF